MSASSAASTQAAASAQPAWEAFADAPTTAAAGNGVATGNGSSSGGGGAAAHATSSVRAQSVGEASPTWLAGAKQAARDERAPDAPAAVPRGRANGKELGPRAGAANDMEAAMQRPAAGEHRRSASWTSSQSDDTPPATGAPKGGGAQRTSAHGGTDAPQRKSSFADGDQFPARRASSRTRRGSSFRSRAGTAADLRLFGSASLTNSIFGSFRTFGVGDSDGVPACMTINPDKPFRICWELLGIIVIMWVTMSLPFKIAFLNDHIDDHDPNFVLQVFVDLFFFTDVILNFFTAYYDKNDALIKDGKRIKVHYLKTWFVVDFIGAIPFDYIVFTLSQRYYAILQGTKALRILKLLRLFRLLRLHNLYRFLGRFEEHLSTNIVKIFKLSISLILWLHVDACMFFLVARWHQLETGHFAPDSWVALNNLQHSDVWVQYLYSLFHVTGHMISISTGLVNPQRVDDIVATTVSMLIGCALYAGIIGTTASIIQASDPSGAEFYRQWDQLKAFMRHKGVPAELRDRLRSYFNTRWKSRKVFDEDAIMASLPGPYVRSLVLHDCQFLLKSSPLLQHAGEGFVNAIVPILRQQVVLEREVIIEEGEAPSDWWLIGRGVVGLYRNGRKFAECDDGRFFGETAFLFGVKSPYTVITETPCQFYSLSRDKFEMLFSQYGELAERMKKESYKQCRRWGLSQTLREASAHADHASEFIRSIPWDWDVAEEELQAEASITGERLDEPDALYEMWAAQDELMEQQRRRYADMAYYDEDYDLFGKLRQGIGVAGRVIRPVVSEIQSTLHHIPTTIRSHRHGEPQDGVEMTQPEGAEQRQQQRDFVQQLRRFGQSMETAFRSPTNAIPTVHRGAVRFGTTMRDGVRAVANRLSVVGAGLGEHGGHPSPHVHAFEVVAAAAAGARSEAEAEHQRHVYDGSVDTRGMGSDGVLHAHDQGYASSVDYVARSPTINVSRSPSTSSIASAASHGALSDNVVQGARVWRGPPQTSSAPGALAPDIGSVIAAPRTSSWGADLHAAGRHSPARTDPYTRVGAHPPPPVRGGGQPSPARAGGELPRIRVPGSASVGGGNAATADSALGYAFSGYTSTGGDDGHSTPGVIHMPQFQSLSASSLGSTGSGGYGRHVMPSAIPPHMRYAAASYVAGGSGSSSAGAPGGASSPGMFVAHGVRGGTASAGHATVPPHPPTHGNYRGASAESPGMAGAAHGVALQPPKLSHPLPHGDSTAPPRSEPLPAAGGEGTAKSSAEMTSTSHNALEQRLRRRLAHQVTGPSVAAVSPGSSPSLSPAHPPEGSAPALAAESSSMTPGDAPATRQPGARRRSIEAAPSPPWPQPSSMPNMAAHPHDRVNEHDPLAAAGAGTGVPASDDDDPYAAISPGSSAALDETHAPGVGARSNWKPEQ